MLFTWASWQQHQVNISFAKLRTSAKGEVVNYEHSIPHGGWFEYVSCPNYLMEIVIYLSLTVIGGFYRVTLFSIFVFVITNQLVAGYASHQWYRSHFGSKYPSNRTAVIPFII
jgi:hypothetical protein